MNRFMTQHISSVPMITGKKAVFHYLLLQQYTYIGIPIHRVVDRRDVLYINVLRSYMPVQGLYSAFERGYNILNNIILT